MTSKPRDASHQNPPGDLKGFPDVRLHTTKIFHRCHRTANGCWYFASATTPGEGGRWDLTGDHGTCYMADTELGALMEAIGPDLAAFGHVPETFLTERTITQINLPTAAKTADLTSSGVSAFGVTAELTGAIPYALTQEWADAFHKEGFGGVRYMLRFHPNTNALGLFGPTGPASHPVGPAAAALQVAADNDIAIKPIPTNDEMNIVEPDSVA